MKIDKIVDAIGQADDEMVEKTETYRKPKSKRRWGWLPLTALGTAAALALGIFILPLFSGEQLLDPSKNSTEYKSQVVKGDYPIILATYPLMAQYPDANKLASEEYDAAFDTWWQDRRISASTELVDENAWEEFVQSTLPLFLDTSKGQNAVYSPINIYLALAMLAEVADGDSRAQILAAMGLDNINTAAKQAGILWQKHYIDDGASKSILANSFWLADDFVYKKETLERLAEMYFASSFQGEMGSEDYTNALRNWLNEQTGGLLEESIEGIEFDTDTIMALASTIYFQSRWADEFVSENNVEQIFHTPKGGVLTEFMTQSRTSTYYWHDKFSAISKNLNDMGNIWFILPDEDVSTSELLNDDAIMELVKADYDYPNQKYLIVNLSLPKFDISSDIDLTDGLKALGITDIFNVAKSDFSALTENANGIILTKADHAARVTVDEEGVKAAAYTVLMKCGSAAPPDEKIDFVLDRPFIFVITGNSGLPLFVGVVNNPAA